ncbi:MAG: hypothetical protein QMD22_11195 [archaeon]|nr:hypothetical protein [archaeon]
MRVAGWNNGSPGRTGAGYGIRIVRNDRDRYLQKVWDSVVIELEGDETVTINLSQSFWRGCIELRSARIGKWMIERGLAPWPKGSPPELELEPITDREFRLRCI